MSWAAFAGGGSKSRYLLSELRTRHQLQFYSRPEFHPRNSVTLHGPTAIHHHHHQSAILPPRIMKSTREQRSTPSRKKSCLQCAKSKVRCGLERPYCDRCVAANRQCRYATAAEDPSSPVGSRHSAPPIQSVATPASLSTAFTDPTDATLVGTTAGSHPTPLPFPTQPPTTADCPGVFLDFSNLDLVPLVDADQIRSRWLRPFLAVGEQVPKAFHPYTLQYIRCVLRTYPKQMVEKNGVPPIIHPMQISDGNSSVALANCYSLVRLWHHRAAGSEHIVAETVQREMERVANYVLSFFPKPASDWLT